MKNYIYAFFKNEEINIFGNENQNVVIVIEEQYWKEKGIIGKELTDNIRNYLKVIFDKEELNNIYFTSKNKIEVDALLERINITESEDLFNELKEC